ncbi:hypothetical protein SAMN05443668_102688 [Cryptosporangium aurantiacum]|uniref:Uncharacterized protein n=1 Tax=Cryptosporangium aurantiacum TaxID=134849 RepID=A0A1M7NK22_9ACTN|nr:hypothetical protein SAMN05443668_102688 [Cryptosporangium aurantiacum]
MKLSQERLAHLLGGEDPLSAPLISSWERANDPVVPPEGRLRAYARLFATERSVPEGRLLEEEELTPNERERVIDLEHELLALRRDALAPVAVPVAEWASAIVEPPVAKKLGRGTWRFENERPVAIVASELPVAERPAYADSYSPDYVEMYRYADLDAMVELYGHIRATNPQNTRIRFRSRNTLTPDDFSSHLVLLGGVDWNPVTRALLDRLELPIRQVSSADRAEGAYFEVNEGGDRHRYSATVAPVGEGMELREDVGLFYRGPNPFNRHRTLTICNAMYGRGTLGAVRALTDAWFRDRNEEFLEERFGDAEEFCLLVRVPVFEGHTVTPDWTVPETRLFEWARGRRNGGADQ